MSKYGYYVVYKEEIEEHGYTYVEFFGDKRELLDFVNQERFLGRDDQDRWANPVFTIVAIIKGKKITLSKKEVEILKEYEIRED